MLTDVTTDMVITKEETFGPVAPLDRFKTDAEAIRRPAGAPTLPPPLAGEGPGRRLQGYGLEVRSGLPVSRSTGTETCS